MQLLSPNSSLHAPQLHAKVHACPFDKHVQSSKLLFDRHMQTISFSNSGAAGDWHISFGCRIPVSDSFLYPKSVESMVSVKTKNEILVTEVRIPYRK